MKAIIRNNLLGRPLHQAVKTVKKTATVISGWAGAVSVVLGAGFQLMVALKLDSWSHHELPSLKCWDFRCKGPSFGLHGSFVLSQGLPLQPRDCPGTY